MPWTMPHATQLAAGCVIGRDYPPPIVDHAAAVREAKRRLAAVRNDVEARAEARDVARRHGSRRDRRGALQQDPVRRRLAGGGGRHREAGRQPDREAQRMLPFDDGEQAADGSGG
jgi:deoxyribodipyrimidine photo-lyase